MPDAARPPRGCSFHPRCPRAFEVCGWETRDLRDLLETHWARKGAEEYERERPLFGDLEALATAPAEATTRVPAARGAGATTCSRSSSGSAARIRTSRSGRACASLRSDGDAVVVEWNEAREPRLVPAGSVQVECHLYD